MKLVGILLILNSIAASSYWITAHGTHKGAVLTLCSLAVFAGIAFLISDRITELSMKGIGTIKAAAEQASADANVVSELKKRVEDQSATVDLVAKEAADAKKLVNALSLKNSKAEEKLSQLDKSINDGNLAVKELQIYTQFNRVVLAAKNDSRRAYEQLWAWSADSSYPLQKDATQTIQTIVDQHDPKMTITNTSISLKNGKNPLKLSLSDLRIAMLSTPPNIRRCVVEFVWRERTDISKKDRLEFLVDVLRSDESLLVVEYAGRYFEEGTGDKLKPLAIKQHLEWWKKNKGTIE
ncbi:hypothetical protein ES703_118763 [subsurface metagenome]